MAELLPDRPKYEKTLWRQLGWVRSVVASKFGAESSLLVSPANVNVGCCELELELEVALEAALVLAPEEEVRKSIHGTATCFPLPDALEALEEVAEVVELDGDELEELPPDNEITANSNRPEFGFTMKSLIVPI